MVSIVKYLNGMNMLSSLGVTIQDEGESNHGNFYVSPCDEGTYELILSVFKYIGIDSKDKNILEFNYAYDFYSSDKWNPEYNEFNGEVMGVFIKKKYLDNLAMKGR